MRVCGPLFGALVGAALLQVCAPPPAAAAVYSPQQALPSTVIQDFLKDPAALLEQYPNGGPQMIVRVRDLAGSDPATLNAIVGLLATANSAQSSAIGTGLGQVALLAVKTDQAYANQIQEAIAGAVKGQGVGPVSISPGAGSSSGRVGSAVKTIDQVQGITDKGEQVIGPGSEVYLNEVVKTGASGKAELLFADRTNLAVAPMTTIRLDQFVYDPSSGSGDVVVNVTEGTFRFITGVQPAKNYKIVTPYATMGVRGTEFIVTVTPTGLQISVVSGEVTVTTSTGQQITVAAGNTLSVSATGVVTGPTPTTASQQSTIFADLGTPTTNVTVADALAAFSAATGTSATAATGGTGGAGGGGGGTGGGGGAISVGSIGGGGGGGGTTPNSTTYVVNTPSPSVSLSFTAASPGTTTSTTTGTVITTATINTVSSSVSPP
jgi:hypothetical protein